MDIVVQILVALVLAAVAYFWIKKKNYESKVKWIPKAEGHPIFRNVLEFTNSTENIAVMSKHLRKHNGLCRIDLLVTEMAIVSDLKVLEFLLTTTKILSKSAEYRFFQRWLGNGLLTSKGQRWKKSRKLITPAFHFSILTQFIPIYEAKADIMLQLLEKEVGKDSVDIYPYVTLCSLDIISETAMGVSVNAQTKAKSEYVLAVQDVCRITVGRIFSAIKQMDFLYPFTKDYHTEVKHVKFLHSYTESIIKARKEQLKNESTKTSERSNEDEMGVKKKVAFLDLLLQSTVDGKPLPDWYIREEVDTLMFEGHDTTASAVSFALYCLARHPEVQAAAIEEQKSIFHDDLNRPVTNQDILEMKYLELVIKETLRLYPSVPFHSRETEFEIPYKDGKVFPKGFPMLILITEVHKNPEIYPDPEKFDPSRFERMEGTSPFAFIPFSAGPRNCIGQKFAIQEMKVVLSKVLRKYELLPAVPEHKVILVAEAVIKSSNGIKIKLNKRKWD